MNEKFRMKLVIDEVTTPALYARLSAAGSARQRATILRLLAESALRGAAMPELQPMAMPGFSGEPAASLPSSTPPPTGSSIEVSQPVSQRTEHPGNEGVSGAAHDVEGIADQFAAFLG
ncbi:hypothetical protein [Paraburkholderia sp. CI3]|uniref:hypothetical protein n=1 Tax=Paraburkholderia sp. CI3 TaxID=2991060 RepID=UPI003D2104D6